MNNNTILIPFKRVYYRLTRERLPDLKFVKSLFLAKSGLEVGGPSRIFRDGGFIPLYHEVKSLDGCNFSNTTIWEGSIESGKKYHYYNNKKGVQYILEASELNPIANATYEFVISSNCLEHVANPLKAVEEWIRVVKKEGILLLVLPNKDYCFDHKRSVTTFSHLLSDFESNTQEDDLNHLEEILEFHDLEMDKWAGTFENFRERSLRNFENRALHQHVFDMTVLKEIFHHFKLEILFTCEGRDFVIIGKKKKLIASGTNHKRAYQLSLFTIYYNMVEGVVSMLLGYQDETLALFGFGVDSFIEVLSGIAIAVMIKRIQRNPESLKSEFERRALKVTGTAFYILSFGLLVGIVLNLFNHRKPETTLWGTVISLISIIVMVWLMNAKKKTGKALGSDPILADANCTKVCVYMSVVLLVSSLIYELTGFVYADVIGTTGLIYFSVSEGREAFEKAKGKSCGCGSDGCH